MLSAKYGQTYPELMNQAIHKGLSDQELLKLKKCYEYAQALFDGMYRGQHSPFIGHLTRTASILLHQAASLNVVCAGMLHAAYMVGCFADRRHGKATEAHRLQLKRDMGDEVETLIYDYDCFPWYQKNSVVEHAKNIESYDERKRSLVLMRLCNDLEDYLDLGIAYRGVFPFQKKVKDYGAASVELASKLGKQNLALELKEVFDANLKAEIPTFLHTGYRDSYQLPLTKWLRKSFKEKAIIVGKKKIKSLLSINRVRKKVQV